MHSRTHIAYVSIIHPHSNFLYIKPRLCFHPNIVISNRPTSHGTFPCKVLETKMMDKLAIVFVALFVAVTAASPHGLLTNLKSLEHVKRAATLLKPLELVSEQKKAISRTEIELVISQLDQDKDGMLNVAELKLLLLIGGTSHDQLDTQASTLMTFFDQDKNQKLDVIEMEAILRIAGY